MNAAAKRSGSKRFVDWTVSFLISVFCLVTAFVGFTWYQISGEKAFRGDGPFIEKGHFVPDLFLGWRLRPNLKIHAEEDPTKVIFQTNRYGFRSAGEELPTQGKAIVLGDSFVQGYFLRDEETISAQLGKRLGGYTYNFGIGGYSTDQEYLVGREALKKVKADAVVLFLFYNDLPYLKWSKMSGMWKPKLADEGGPLHDVPEGAVFSEGLSAVPKRISLPDYDRDRRNFFKRQIAANWLMLGEAAGSLGTTWPKLHRKMCENWELGAFDPARGVCDYYTDESLLEWEWKTAFQLLSRLKELTEERGSRFLVFMIPEEGQVLSADEQFYAPQRKFLKSCRRNRIECLEPHRRYEREQKARDLYFRDDGHFSPAGAALAAELVADHLARKEALTCGP